jgi:hypothetical protein
MTILKIVKKLLFLSLPLFLLSCSNYANLKSDEKNLAGKGVAIMSVTDFETISPIDINMKHEITYIKFCKIEDKKCFKVKKDKNLQYLAFKINAGIYYIREIGLDGFFIDTFIFKLDKKAKKPILASFQIQKDEIIYFGSIENILGTAKFFEKDKFYFCIKNNLPEAQSYVKQNFPFLDSENIKFQPLELGTQSEYKCE